MNPLSGGLTSAVLLGAGLGFALWLLIAAVRPPAPDLARATRRWDRRRHSYAQSTGDTELGPAVARRPTDPRGIPARLDHPHAARPTCGSWTAASRSTSSPRPSAPRPDSWRPPSSRR